MVEEWLRLLPCDRRCQLLLVGEGFIRHIQVPLRQVQLWLTLRLCLNIYFSLVLHLDVNLSLLSFFAYLAKLMHVYGFLDSLAFSVKDYTASFNPAYQQIELGEDVFIDCELLRSLSSLLKLGHFAIFDHLLFLGFTPLVEVALKLIRRVALL